jgi:four helix bundle protein
MALVERFEDLTCWQESRSLVRMVYQACRKGELAKDFETRVQLKRAALSVMNNIAEGFGRRFFEKEFIRFLDISQGSSCEVRSMTYVLEDMEYLALDQITPIRVKSEQVGLKILALINHLRSRKR